MATKQELELQVAELQAKVAMLTEQLSAAQEALNGAHEKEDWLQQAIDASRGQVAELREKLAEKPQKDPARGDGVVLDGKEYEVVHRNTCKEFINDYHKRLVREDDTVVVIPKKGG